MAKRISTKAFAVVRRDEIDITSIEPFTDEGRKDLIRNLNRPAGERVEIVTITVAPATTGKQT